MGQRFKIPKFESLLTSHDRCLYVYVLYDMPKLNFQRDSVWPCDTSPEQTDWLIVANNENNRFRFL